MKIIIRKIADADFAVEYDYGNGRADLICRCATENEARACVIGAQFGTNAVKQMIGIGPSFSGQVDTTAKQEG